MPIQVIVAIYFIGAFLTAVFLLFDLRRYYIKEVWAFIASAVLWPLFWIWLYFKK